LGENGGGRERAGGKEQAKAKVVYFKSSDVGGNGGGVVFDRARTRARFFY